MRYRGRVDITVNIKRCLSARYFYIALGATRVVHVISVVGKCSHSVWFKPTASSSYVVCWVFLQYLSRGTLSHAQLVSTPTASPRLEARSRSLAATTHVEGVNTSP